jgi:RNA polymerase sigma-70 factor (ECF subfamily)
LDAGRAVERYERFFREAEPMLRRVAFVYTGNSEQHWSKVANHPHPDAWCRTVLRNLATSGFRRTRLERAHAATRVEPVPEPSADSLGVFAAVRRLPRNQQHAVVLHDVLGYTTGEIAVELEVPAGTVRSWLSRAHQRLAVELGEGRPDVVRRPST